MSPTVETRARPIASALILGGCLAAEVAWIAGLAMLTVYSFFS